MEEKTTVLTREGLAALEEELKDLRVNKLMEVAEEIKVARAHGDASENAELDAAKDAQRDIQARIEEIEKILANVEIIEDNSDADTVGIGNSVKILDMQYDEEMEFRIVGSMEADSLNGKISNESPVGMALLGAKVGDVVSVSADAGVLKYKVLGIEKTKK